MAGTTRNTKPLEDCRDALLKAASLVQDVIDGKMYQTGLAEPLGIKPTSVQSCVARGFRPYIRSQIMNISDFYPMLEQTRTPGDRLLLSLLGYGLHPLARTANPDRFVFLPEYDEDVLWDNVEQILKGRELDVVRRANGYPDKQPEPFYEIGKSYCITIARIQQVYHKAIRRLNSHGILKTVFPASNLVTETATQYMLKAAKEASDRYLDAWNRYDKAKALCEASEALTAASRLLEANLSPDAKKALEGPLNGLMDPVPLDACNLSVRSGNILKRAGYEFLDDVARLTLDELMAIPHMGAHGIRELDETFFRYLGLCRNDLSPYRIKA